MNAAPAAPREPLEERGLALLAASLVEAVSPDELLTRVCRLIVDHRPVVAADLACMGPEGDPAAIGAFPDLVLPLARGQFDLGEGPSVEAHRLAAPVAEDDLAGQGAKRWPRLRQVIPSDAARVRSEPVRVGDRVAGSLDLISGPDAPPDSLTDAAIHQLARIAVAHAGAAISSERYAHTAGQLQHALHSRVRIEQAKGALAAHLGRDPEEAFRRLRRSARNRSLQLHRVADEVVAYLATAHGASPGSPPAPLTEPDNGGGETSGLEVHPTPTGLRLVGAADLSAAERLEAALAQLNGQRSVHVDLSELQFLDARCARALEAAAVTGRELRLAGPTPAVAHVLRLLQIDEHPSIRIVSR